MRFDPMSGLDAMDWKLLDLLQRDARMSLAALGRRLHLAPPSVGERIKRLEDRGVIKAYRAEIDLAGIGRAIHVYLRVVVQPRDYDRFKRTVAALEDVFECHHVTGAESFVLRAGVATVPQLEELIEKLTAYGPTTTNVIMSTNVDRRHFMAAQRKTATPAS